MKTLKSIFILLFIIATNNLLSAAVTDTLRFEVKGNCSMCKDRIETSLEVRGIKSAVWDVDTKIIVVVYDPSKIKEDKIHELISKVGHDTGKMKAPDKAYNNLHKCCMYDREKGKNK